MESQDLRKMGDSGTGVVGELSAGDKGEKGGGQMEEEEEVEEEREALEEVEAVEELLEEGGESDMEEVGRQRGKRRGKTKIKVTQRRDGRHQLGSRGLTK